MFTIGKIINTHGIKGEVKVKQITDFMERFNVGSVIYLIDTNEQIIPLEITSVRTQKDYLLIRFTGYDSINEVESFKGLMLKIKNEQLTPLNEHEFYFHEIIGCTVSDMSGTKIGVVDSILTPGANDVWVVKNDQHKEFLIPYIQDVVKEIDVEKKQITIEPMEGLLE